MTNQQIIRQAETMRDYVVDCRRTIHRFAEVGGTEVKTSGFIQEQIKRLGLPFELVSTTGLIAELDTGRPGPHIALRADIDALPIPESEENLAGPRTCRSDDPNTCHACGHDAHSAMLLGAMKILCAHRDELCGVIYFCFEEGEENGRGVAGMLKALESRAVDTCWAIHVSAALESGKITMDTGAMMAGVVPIRITVTGKGGHGSRPDLSINPVFCAAAILTNAATAWANQISPRQPVTLGITSIQGGQTGNVFPDTARILGTCRFFDPEAGQKALELLLSVAEHTAAMNKCSVDTAGMKSLLAPTMNDPHYSALARAAIAEILPKDSVVPTVPWFASETYSMYCKHYPSVMAHLGIQNFAYGSGAEHHNTCFDVDENVLPTGVMATVKYVCAVQDDYLNRGKG